MTFKSNTKKNTFIDKKDISYANSTTGGLKNRITSTQILNKDLVSNGPQFYNIALQKFHQDEYMT